VTHSILFKIIEISIQPEWVIEEKVKIFLIDEVKIPPALPKIKDEIVKKTKIVSLNRNDSIQKGAIFCEVKRRVV
jgi:hypothetical protein